MTNSKQEGVRVASAPDPKNPRVRIHAKKDPGPKPDDAKKPQSPTQGKAEKSERPVVRRKQKLPPASAKARTARRPTPGRGKTKPEQRPQRPTRPGRSNDVKQPKKDTAKEIPEALQIKPEDLKVPAGMLMIQLTGIIADHRNDERCIATKKEAQAFEDLFNAWIDYRLPALTKFAPDLALAVPWVCYFARISNLPEKSKARNDPKQSEE